MIRTNKKLQISVSRLGYLLLGLSTLSIILSTAVLLSKNAELKIIEKSYEKGVSINATNKFSPEKLIHYLKQMNVMHPDVVYAQAILETGSFTSDMFKYNNNLFGMKEAYNRAMTCRGTKRGHAYYHSWLESLYDYALYQNRYLYKMKDKEDYIIAVGKVYAEDGSYEKKLREILSVVEKQKLFQN